MSSTLSSPWIYTSGNVTSAMYHQISLNKDFNLNYDNTTGDVTIENKQISIKSTTHEDTQYVQGVNGNYKTTISIPSKVYLYM